jgi:3',5'-cyclic AMP phosphodiesterase CpdA
VNHATADAVRLAHFSDVHVTAACAWRPADWISKRLSAWINLRLFGRGHRFRLTEQVLEALRGELRARPPHRVVFSGDATALGFEEEMARAAALLDVAELPGIAVPGNHDYCTRRAMRGGHFERYFHPWQAGERVGADLYPFAQRVGHVWLVAVNSATANRWAWDARGAVGSDQLERLQQLLERLEGGPRILVTHYPVGLPGGRPERRVRALRDLDALVEVARRGGISLWLHGHRHDPYHHLPPDLAPFPVVCAGSATQTGHWSYHEYLISGWQLRAQQRIYDRDSGRFRDGPAFEVELARVP